ncbi:MAG: class I SAM-dependent methyltransferase [Planctomycetota bacterium]|nr:class I SAM-dependent methyltransferase [Planctomycetota bacterium]MDA1114772.1 class I SAM-dependent methyltransferase [Planctomycetota bacterium]
MGDPRPNELRQEYESELRAAHYRNNRWTLSPRARRTDAREQAIVESFLQHAAAQMPTGQPITQILDLPCGTGRFRTMLERNCQEVWSGDAAHEMLMQAPPTTGVQMSAHAIPLKENAVSAILCSRLLHHFEHAAQRNAVLQELARVSQRWIILSYFDAANFQAWRNRIRGKFRGRFPITLRTFQSEICAAGLVEHKRVYIARGLSEQVWVLLEKKQSE